MDEPEIFILNEVKDKSYDTTYMWDLKRKDSFQLVNKTEIGPQTWKTRGLQLRETAAPDETEAEASEHTRVKLREMSSEQRGASTY